MLDGLLEGINEDGVKFGTLDGVHEGLENRTKLGRLDKMMYDLLDGIKHGTLDRMFGVY